MGFLRGCIHCTLSKLNKFVRKIDSRVLSSLGGGQGLCDPMPFLRELDTASHPPLHRNKHTDMASASGGGKIKYLFLNQSSSSWTNQPAVQKALVNPEMSWDLKKYKYLGGAMVLSNESHAEGMGSISEQFTLPVTERIQLVSACAAESATYPGVPAVCNQAPGEDGGSWCCLCYSERPEAGQELQCSGKVWMGWRYISEKRAICEYKSRRCRGKSVCGCCTSWERRKMLLAEGFSPL